MLQNGKYPFFLSEALRMSKHGTIIVADNILYKGYVMSNYNKHKQRTAVRNLREYIKLALENPNLKSEILEVRRWTLYKQNNGIVSFDNLHKWVYNYIIRFILISLSEFSKGDVSFEWFLKWNKKGGHK